MKHIKAEIEGYPYQLQPICLPDKTLWYNPLHVITEEIEDTPTAREHIKAEAHRLASERRGWIYFVKFDGAYTLRLHNGNIEVSPPVPYP